VLGDTEAQAQEQWAANLENADVDSGMATLAMFLGVDLLKFDIDEPLPRDLHVPGMRGTFQRYLSMPEGTTLRAWARVEGLYETYQIAARRLTLRTYWSIPLNIPAVTVSTSVRRGGSPTSSICSRFRPS
jgi:hypothetical protein